MKQLPLISIIVPVYNNKMYINRCIESLLSQSYSNIEIILVDDGSIDGTSEICEWYKERNDKIKVIHKENGGVSSARNEGLKIAKGEYICFVDSDDYVLKDYVMHMYELIEQEKADISVCNYIRTKKENYDDSNEENYKVEVLVKEEGLKRLLYKDGITGYAYLKLIKKQLLVDEFFNENLQVAEDLEFIFRIFMKAEKIVLSNKILYIYFQNEKSCMHDVNGKKFEKSWEFVENKLEYIQLKWPQLEIAYGTYLFIGALGYYAHSSYWKDVKEFKKNLIISAKKYSKIVYKNAECKFVHKLLAVMCQINTKYTCEICRILVFIIEKLNIQIKRAV